MNPAPSQPGRNTDERQPKRSAPRQTTPQAVDARGDAQKLKKNRENLRVDEEHKTPEMRRFHRGTFP